MPAIDRACPNEVILLRRRGVTTKGSQMGKPRRWLGQLAPEPAGILRAISALADDWHKVLIDGVSGTVVRR